MSSLGIMVDIETLGTKVGSMISTVGAVAFDPTLGKIYEGYSLYFGFDLRELHSLGLICDHEAVFWWLGQSDAARSAMTEDRPGGGSRFSAVSGIEALRRLASDANLMITKTGSNSVRWWSHGDDFDLVLLADVADRAKVNVPWGFRDTRDTRTIFDLCPDVTIERVGTHHNALDDAIYQARKVCACYEALGLRK